MKKKKWAFALCIILLLTIGLVSYASLGDVCHHCYMSTSQSLYSSQSYSSSLYTLKNGRVGWWPVIYYDDYIRIKYYCAQCGKEIPELETHIFAGTHWEFAN